MNDGKLVHIVDDEEAVRRSIGFLLRTSGYRVETHADGADFLGAATKLEPGCVLMDVRMPQLDGLTTHARLRVLGIGWPVIVLTGHGDLDTALRAMKGGASDFLEKPFAKHHLIAAIESGFRRLADATEAGRDADAARVRIAALTAREREVLDGLAQGLPNKSIAFDFGISARTVEVHRANVMRKLDVHNFPDALRIAFAAGLGRDPSE